MKEKKVEYKVNDTANRLNEIIQAEIKRKTFNKRNNLSGKHSEKGGFDIYNTFSFVITEPNFGPFVKLNLRSTNSNSNGTESNLTLKRVNGTNFNFQFWFILSFIVITLIISVYQILEKGFNENYDFLIMPIIGIIYFLIIEFIAEMTIGNLIKRIEKILKTEQIEFKKL